MKTLKSSTHLVLRLWLALVLAGTAAWLSPRWPWLQQFWNIGYIIAMSLGRFFVYPLMFFSFIIAVARLQREQYLKRVSWIMVLWGLGALFVLTAIATLLVTWLPVPRLALNFEAVELVPPNYAHHVFDTLFPTNLFEIFSNNILLPLILLGLIIGLNLNFDREVTEPSYNLIDSLSRISYRIFGVYARYSPIFVFLLFGRQIYVQKNIIVSTPLQELFIFTFSIALGLSLFVMFVAFIIISQRKSSLGWLKNTAYYFPMAIATPHHLINAAQTSWMSHEHIHIKRDLGAFISPIMALFGRIGSGMMVAMTLTIILRSYSNLDFNYNQIMWIFVSTLATVFLSSLSADIPFISMFPLACSLYGNILKGSSVLIEPLIIPLVLGSVFLDGLFLVFVLQIMQVFIPNLSKNYHPKYHRNRIDTIKPEETI